MEPSSRVLLLTLICICVAFTVGTIQVGPKSRLVGAQEAVRGQFPWQAEVRSTTEDGLTQMYCSGSMISKDYVITSAECIPVGSTVEIVLGAWNITDTTEVGRVNLVSDFYFIHPNYTEATLSNNLAVLHLPRAIFPSPYIQPARLPPASDVNNTYDQGGIYSRLSGWGADGAGLNGTYSEILRFTDNEVVNLTKCVEHYGADWVTDNHICINTTGARGPCFNDSGIPMAIQDTSGVYYQIGIFSFHDIESCIRGIPVVGTKLANYLEWIYSVTGIPPNNDDTFYLY